MIRSLRFKLVVAFALVVTLTVTAITTATLERTRREIEEFGERAERLDMIRMEHQLLGFYSNHDSWRGVSPLIAEISVISGQYIRLLDAAGNVVASSLPQSAESPSETALAKRELRVADGNRSIGTLWVGAPSILEAMLTANLVRSINASVIWAAVVAVAVAVLLAVLVLGPIAAPFQELAAAARRAGTGDFSVRVRRRASGELGELVAAFNAMAADLEGSERLRRDLVADTAHELRTPLSNIRGYVEACQDRLVPPLEAIRCIGEETALLQRLVGDLHDLASVEGGIMELVRERVEVAALIGPAIAAARSQASARGVSVASEVQPRLPLVDVDVHRITQVLHNLLTNAIAHTEAGGKVSVEARQAADESVAIEVVDTGVGMTAQELGRIFDRFYRADPSRARATGGSGLGLTIARHLVEAHGGTIGAESTPGRGTRVRFTLPAGVATQHAETVSARRS